MGIEMLTEEQYRDLQGFGEFDTKTSSWVKTPQILEDSAELFFVIAATTLSLCTTTEQNPTIPPGASAAC